MNAIEARDIMFGVVRTYATAQSLTVKWPDTAFTKPDTAAYLDVSMRHAVQPQASLSNTDGIRIWDNRGVLSITVNAPIARGLLIAYTHGQGLVDALRTAQESVWFRNIRLRELGSEGGYERIMVLADFEYRDIQ